MFLNSRQTVRVFVLSVEHPIKGVGHGYLGNILRIGSI